MSSLRGRLLTSLVALYGLFAGIVLLTNYRQFESNITGFMDRQMHNLAVSYSHSAAAQPPHMRAATEYAIQHQGAAVVEFWRPDGTLAFSNRTLTGVGLQPADGFHVVRVGARSWRIYTLRVLPLAIQVITSEDFRRRVI